MKSTSTGRAHSGSRAWAWAWALLLAAVGGVLCFVPLFNLLGYESSLVLAVFGSIAGVRQGTLAVRRGRERRHPPAAPLGAGLDADAQPLAAVLRLSLRALFAAELLLVPPLLLLAVNALRVRNCNFGAGLGFFAMMPVLSTACAVAVGVVSGLATASRGRALFFGCAVLAASLGISLLRFLTTPAIYAYDPFFGYFPGALYDEEVAIGGAFFAARALHLSMALAALCAAAAILHGDTLRLRLLQKRRRPLALGLALLFGGTAAGLYCYGGRLGIYRDTAAIHRYLYAEQRTQVAGGPGHFVLRYRPGGPVARDLPLFLREHELRYAQLRELLDVEPDWRSAGILGALARLVGLEPAAPLVVSYLFDSAEEKRRWMGAGGTYIAKPWRREIYLQYEPWPHPVLRHELAHIFAGAAGDRLLRMATRYGLPQPGIIEGLAVAADWRGAGELGGHQVVLAMRRAGLEPPLEKVFGQGLGGLSFYGLPAGRAYAVAGSFCRYLLDRFGAAPLLLAYHRGGSPADFAAAFAAPFSSLKADWSRFVDEQPLPAAAKEVAAERLRRKAVFRKPCAHELALRKQAAYAAAEHGDVAEAVRLLTTVCRDDPDEPQHLAELLDVKLEAREFAEAEQAGQSLLHHPQSTPVLITRAQSRLGDLAVRRGNLDAGLAYYQAAAKGPEPESAARLTTAKLVALASERAGPLLLRVLVGSGKGPRERGDAVSVYTLLEAAAAEPNLGLTHYILGRILFERGGYAEAEKELARAEELELPDFRFVEQALLLHGQAALLDGRSAAAAALFDTLGQRLSAAEQGKLLQAQDMADRARRWDSLDASGKAP